MDGRTCRVFLALRAWTCCLCGAKSPIYLSIYVVLVYFEALCKHARELNFEAHLLYGTCRGTNRRQANKESCCPREQARPNIANLAILGVFLRCLRIVALSVPSACLCDKPKGRDDRLSHHRYWCIFNPLARCASKNNKKRKKGGRILPISVSFDGFWAPTLPTAT